jgi:methylase of polypeptide subunit release factors
MVQVCLLDVMDALSGRFDFTSPANPPYVGAMRLPTCNAKFREHEPHVALFSPEDELAIYRASRPRREGMLQPADISLLEIGLGMVVSVLLGCSDRLGKQPRRPDIQGLPRSSGRQVDRNG